jgi:general stress protein 26
MLVCLKKQKTMTDKTNLKAENGIKKLQSLVKEIDTCLFCTNLKTDDGATCRPMSTQKVCDQGNLWFFSDVNSDKNKEIKQNKHVQLFFSHPGKNSYLVVNGEAEIIIDKTKAEELWTSVAKIWFKEGIDDPSLSIIKVKPVSAYYWDTDGNKMINFLKMAASVVTGKDLVSSKEGAITV